MPRAWAIAIAAAMLLAGCAAKAPSRADVAASGLGSLRGVVVDAAIRPLGGVAVHLVPGDLNATTGPDGQFNFTGLAPSDYTLQAARDGYLPGTTVAHVVAGTPAAVQLQLEVKPGGARFANVYKFDGLYECGVWPTNGCANVNIVTGIMLCETPAPCANVTSDRSIFLQWVDGGMSFLQSEVAWSPTLDAGAALEFGIGGANKQELAQGVAPAYNFTDGVSPLVLRLTNHEGPDAWCQSNTPPCGTDALNQSHIGLERALLVQIGSGATYRAPADCMVADPCGAGASFEQHFEVFTTTFFGYEPPADWAFANEGSVPPPPPT